VAAAAATVAAAQVGVAAVAQTAAATAAVALVAVAAVETKPAVVPTFSPAAVAADRAALVVAKALAATTAIVGIGTAQVTTPRAAVITLRVGRVTESGTETVIATGTATAIAIAIEAETEIVIATAIAAGIYMSIATRAFTSRRIMATMAIARAPTSVVTGTASSPGRTMRAADKAMIRSVHTFTGKALRVFSLSLAPETLTNWLIGTASCVAMMKVTDATNYTQYISGVIDSYAVAVFLLRGAEDFGEIRAA
jgi:hypothetical protein